MEPTGARCVALSDDDGDDHGDDGGNDEDDQALLSQWIMLHHG